MINTKLHDLIDNFARAKRALRNGEARMAAEMRVHQNEVDRLAVAQAELHMYLEEITDPADDLEDS